MFYGMVDCAGEVALISMWGALRTKSIMAKFIVHKATLDPACRCYQNQRENTPPEPSEFFVRLNFIREYIELESRSQTLMVLLSWIFSF